MRSGPKVMPLLRLAIMPAVVVVGLLIAWKQGYFSLDHRKELVDTVHHLRGVRGMEILYVLTYALAIIVILPATIATLVGGALFGAWTGAGLAWAGAMLGTVLTHLLARHVARTPMRRLFGEHHLLRQLREHDTVLGLFQLRILPVAPFAVLDYVAGVAGVSLPRLLVATAFGVIPSVVAYSYVGAELMRGFISGADTSHEALWIAAAVTAGMLLLSAVPRFFRRSRA